MNCKTNEIQYNTPTMNTTFVKLITFSFLVLNCWFKSTVFTIQLHV